MNGREWSSVVAWKLLEMANGALGSVVASVALIPKLPEKLRFALGVAMGRFRRVALRPLSRFLDGKGGALKWRMAALPEE